MKTPSDASKQAAVSQWIIVLLAMASGVAGLGYQVIWAEQFSLLLGSTQVAVAAVLAAFMLGLTLGSVWVGRFCRTLVNPLRWYAAAELVIAVSALAIRPVLLWVADASVPWLGASLDGTAATPEVATALHLGLAAILMLLPTMAMGATLPLLVEGTVANRGSARAGTGLYAANTFGAAVGALGAALFLLPALGLADAIYCMALINLLVAGVAWSLATPRADVETAERQDHSRVPRGPLLLVAMCGVVSFTYEVFWTRVLVHHLGADVYAFGAMLAVLLLGIALGALLVRRVVPIKPGITFAQSQVLLAVAALVSFQLIDILPAPSMGQVNFWAMIFDRLVYVSALLLPVAILIGVALPLALYWLNERHDYGGRGVAYVYAANTLGAIVGALLGALWLMPNLGFDGTLQAVIGLGCLIGLVAWWLAGATQRVRGAVVALSLLVAGLAWPPVTPEHLFRTTPLNPQPARGQLVFAEVGRTSTVALLEQVAGWRLLTNGLPESMIQRPGENPGAYDVSRWLSLLPSTIRPDARSMLVVGLGGAGTIEEVVDTIDTIDVVELEPQVLAANQLLADRRQSDPLADSRVTVHLNDARMELKRSSRTFDLIVAQPSHPWTSGASHLYTKEYFQLVRARLSEQGVFSQWIGLQFVDERLVLALLATLQEVFGHVQVFAPAQQAALVFVASPAMLPANPALEYGRYQDHWHRLGVLSAESVLAAMVIDERMARNLAAAGELTTDYNNLLKYAAPRVLGAPIGLDGLHKLLGGQHASLAMDALEGQIDSGRLLAALSQLPGSGARLYAGDHAGRLALLNTWRPVDRTRRVDLVPALTDDALKEQAIATLFRRFQDRLVAGEPLPSVRHWFRPDVEHPLLELMAAGDQGLTHRLAEKKAWLSGTFEASSPYYFNATRLQALAAIATKDDTWMRSLLKNDTAAFEDAARLRYELAMATDQFAIAASALFKWDSRLRGRAPGPALRDAIARFEQSAGEAVEDPRFGWVKQRLQMIDERPEPTLSE